MEMQGLEKRVLSSRTWRLVSERVVVPLATSVTPLPASADVLQLGCGGGFETSALARRFGGWTITATDGYQFDELKNVLGQAGFSRYRAKSGGLWYRQAAIKER